MYEPTCRLPIFPSKTIRRCSLLTRKKFKSLQDVIDQCKAEPESVVFGRETGTQAHLVALALEDAAGVKFNQVDIPPVSNLIAALMGGQNRCVSL